MALFCNERCLNAENIEKKFSNDRNKIIQQFKDVNLDILKPWTKQSMNLISQRYNNRYHFAHLAAGKGNIEALRAVLKEYGNINQVGENNITPLFMALTSADLKTVKFLIEKKAKIGGFSKEEKLIYGTIILGNVVPKIVEYLIKNGLPKNYREKKNKNDATNFIGAIYLKENYKLLEVFLKNKHYDKGLELDKIYEFAIRDKKNEVIKMFEKYNIKPSVYALLLMKNPTKKQFKLLEKKLKNKIDFRKNESLFLWAILSHNPKTMTILLKYFPEEANNTYYEYDNSGYHISPLNVAIAQNKNNLKLLKVLLENGAKVNPEDKIFIHPLIWATTQKKLNAIKMLSDAGSDFKIADSNDKSLLAFAIVVNASNDIINYYIAKKVNLNYIFQDLPAIAWAVKKERLEVIELLLKHGAKRDFIDPETKKSISIVDWTKKLNAKTSLKNYSKIMKVLK